MTREQKIQKRIERKTNRRQERAKELVKIESKMVLENMSFEKARAQVRGKFWGIGFLCDMRYAECEARGYCNGDC